MWCGIDPHWYRVGVFSRNPFVNLEQVSVLLANCLQAEPVNRIGKVQIDSLTMRAHTSTFIAYFLRIARSDIAGYKVAKTWITVFEIVIALTFRNLTWRSGVTFSLWNPYPPI